MIVALVVAAVGLAASGPASVFLVLRYCANRDHLDTNEREQLRHDLQILLNRVQAPETAVAQVVAESAPDGPMYVGFDNDEEFYAAKAEEGQVAR